MLGKIKRRHFLWLGLGTLTTIGTIFGAAEFKRQRILALDDPKRDFNVSGETPLKARAAAKKLIFGAAVRQDHLAQDAEYAALIARECNILVPEWALKWSTPDRPMRPNAESFDFRAADELLAFANKHNMLYRGHTLVWHQSLPSWFDKVTPENARALLEKHIKTVVGRYAGKIHSWDVVNEAIDEGKHLPNGHRDGLRATPWLKLLGDDYIDYAFRLAREADPSSMLVYNDYGLDYDTARDEAKRNAVLKLLEKLKSKGTPIDALGIQGHLYGSEDSFSAKKFRDFLRNVASLGLKILITELDVTDKELPVGEIIRDRLVARAYEDYLDVVLQEKAVVAVITWGLSDKYTWLSEFEPRPDKAPVRPLLYDTKMQRKLAWNAVARAFDKATPRL